MLASSSGASISSSRQNGLGLYLKIANMSAIAVSAFSPPERSCTLWSRLPGGWAIDVDSALELIVLVEQHQPGAPAAEQRAEGALEVLVDRRERLAEALLRGLVDLLDRVVGGGNRVDEILALRGQERVARLEVVELIDGHHVDGAHPLDLRAQVGDHLVRGHGRRRRRRGSRPARRVAAHCRTLPLPPPPHRARRRPASGWRAHRSRSSSSISGADVFDGGLHGFKAGLCEMREIGFRGRARDIEAARPRRGRSRPAVAPRECGSPAQ